MRAVLALCRMIGFLPFFANEVEGFSVEEHVSPEVWFTDQEGVWEWKGPAIRDLGCAYGKFLGNKAAFITEEWFCDFANWRRDGYDFDARFDDELASYAEKDIYDLVSSMQPALSGDLKKAGNFTKGGNTGFDSLISRLQSQCYVLIDDFVYKKDKKGNAYGWGVAEYSTPEQFFGESFSDCVYQRNPQESYQRILQHLTEILPDADQRELERFLKRNTVQSRIRDNAPKDWLVPSNYKYYNVIEAFEQNESILWKQGNDNMRVGDTVYLYVGLPFSAILFRCEITEVDIPFEGKEEHVNIKKMIRIRRLEKYPYDHMPLSRMKEYGVVSVRCTRSMPAVLAEAM